MCSLKGTMAKAYIRLPFFLVQVALNSGGSNLWHKQDPPALTYRKWAVSRWADFPYLFPFVIPLIKYVCIDNLWCFIYWFKLKERFRYELGFEKSWKPWNVLSKPFTGGSVCLLKVVTCFTKSDPSAICMTSHSPGDFSVYNMGGGA